MLGELMSKDKNLTNSILKDCSQFTVRQLNSSEHYLWDSLVQSARTGCFMLSWPWADFNELEGYKTFRYGLYLKEKLVGGCIFYFYPHISKANLLISPGAPLLPPTLGEEGMQLLREKAAVLAKELGVFVFRFVFFWSVFFSFLAGFVRVFV